MEKEDISKSPIQEDAGYAWTHDAQPQSDIDGGDHVEVIQVPKRRQHIDKIHC